MRQMLGTWGMVALVVGAVGIAPALGASTDAGALRTSFVLTYKVTTAPAPSVAGDENYNGPTPDTPITHEGSLDIGLNLRLSANARVFTLISPGAKTGEDMRIRIERLYVDLDDLGIRGLGVRLGRDAIRLGQIGLLLDEVAFEDDRRDGAQVWIPLGPVRLFAFYQWALDDHTTTRRLAGARVETQMIPGWTLGANYRMDIAADLDMGTCPGRDCPTGIGYGFDLDGAIAPGATLTLAYATYTQTGDAARVYLQAIVVLDLAQLVHIRQFEPVVTLWYKNFDPYTMPGGLAAVVSRGNFTTPDDFKIFNINDNLTALGARLRLQVLQNVELFGLEEWGTYKDGGPGYTVFSAGVKYRPVSNTEIKVTYNTYTVDGGMVTTSPVSGFTLANTQLYQVEMTVTW